MKIKEITKYESSEKCTLKLECENPNKLAKLLQLLTTQKILPIKIK